jgi:hypothetical protein
MNDIKDKQAEAQQREHDDGEDEREHSRKDNFGLRIDIHAVVMYGGHHKTEDLEEHVGHKQEREYGEDGDKNLLAFTEFHSAWGWVILMEMERLGYKKNALNGSRHFSVSMLKN